MNGNGKTLTLEELPGLNCGLCGLRSCAEMAEKLKSQPGYVERCIHLSSSNVAAKPRGAATRSASEVGCASCGMAEAHTCSQSARPQTTFADGALPTWRDSLGRDFDFYLEHFPEDPGPREIIIPHNPMITRELDIKEGDILLGRPLGMSCGCPITHCGVAMSVDKRTGVLTWCVTGPLRTRQEGFKDLGYYIAEGYEGIVTTSRVELKVGMRHYFQPRMCMLQWRHSGLINFVNRVAEGVQVRVEGLWIG